MYEWQLASERMWKGKIPHVLQKLQTHVRGEANACMHVRVHKSGSF